MKRIPTGRFVPPILLLTFLVPPAARAVDLSLKIEPGVAVPLGSPQTDRFNLGGAAALKGQVGFGGYVDGSLGLAVLSTIAASRTRHLSDVGHSAALVSGFRYAFVTGAALMLVAFVLLAVLIRERHVARINAEEPVTVSA